VGSGARERDRAGPDGPGPAARGRLRSGVLLPERITPGISHLSHSRPPGLEVPEVVFREVGEASLLEQILAHAAFRGRPSTIAFVLP